jgi:transposase
VLAKGPFLQDKEAKKMVEYVLGVDIAKDSFAVCLMSGENGQTRVVQEKEFINRNSGYEALMKWINKKVSPFIVPVVLEATGNYWKGLAQDAYGWSPAVYVVNPSCIKNYGRTKLRRAKNDRLDAELIAQYGFLKQARRWEPPTRTMEITEQLLSQRDSLVQSKVNIRNTWHALKELPASDPIGMAIQERVINQLEEQIDLLEKRIMEVIRADKEYKDQFDLLSSIPSIGWQTATMVITATRGLRDFSSPRALAAYIGVIPVVCESGGKVYRRAQISPFCHRKLRRLFYMAAISAIRVNPICKALYERLIQKGKPFKVAIIAVAHKLVRIVYGVLLSGKPFDPDYKSKPPHLLEPSMS